MTRRKVVTDDEVRRIRALHVPYIIGYETLARMFGCGVSTIRDICTYRTRIGI
jgi:DNA invertase Pin-like site-specific DNA recombinase